MAEQLTLTLAGSPEPTFENYVAGRNGEALDALVRIARHAIAETGLVVWGAGGAGKTHLLKAAVALAREHGREARFVAEPSLLEDAGPVRDIFIAVDTVDRADDVAQAKLFTLYNVLAACGGQLVAAASVPPARMSLRDDLRTRLGWGLVIEVLPLTDAEKPEALAAYAQSRGFRLPADAIAYLLAHSRRDMASLVATLAALDKHSLALQRPV
ncbi:MAG TPA: DnaA/Hda family protein, partial [Candidatus Saccharimonadia bacterium]|nr:DnaA/Hda family protein [Candidatus Saccharimonadia bacterium]